MTLKNNKLKRLERDTVMREDIHDLLYDLPAESKQIIRDYFQELALDLIRLKAEVYDLRAAHKVVPPDDALKIANVLKLIKHQSYVEGGSHCFLEKSTRKFRCFKPSSRMLTHPMQVDADPKYIQVGVYAKPFSKKNTYEDLCEALETLDNCS
jgi:hypothetical protein